MVTGAAVSSGEGEGGGLGSGNSGDVRPDAASPLACGSGSSGQP